MGPNEVHPRVLRELAVIVAKPVCTIFEKSRKSHEVPSDWRKGNITPVFKKCNKGDPGNYQPVILISVPGNIMAHIVLEDVLNHKEDRQVMKDRQYGFIKSM